MKLQTGSKTFYTRRISREDAGDILTWRYEGVRSVYDLPGGEAALRELQEPLNYALCETFGGKLLAFATLGPAAGLPLSELAGIYEDENYTDIAVGLRPERCGRGLGKYIVSAAVLLAGRLFPGDGFRVTVARNNPAALTIYKAFGFTEIAEFTGEILHPDKKGNIIATETPMEILIAEAELAGKLSSGEFLL